jgi:hypothetical protein
MFNTKVRTDVKPLHVPDLVARYLRYAVRGNQRIHGATVSQYGEFRFGSSGEHWRPFAATEHFSLDTPAFEWDAQIRLAPFLTIRVRDSYLNGVGSTSASLLGHTFMNARPARELNAGALQRYLAEAVWVPPALVAGPGISWRGVDRHTAIATLRDGRVHVALQFTFNDVGEVTQIFSPTRYRSVGGGFVPTPWLVRCYDYIEIDGFRIPGRCDVSWVLADELFTYWKGQVSAARYDFALDRQLKAS